MLCSISVFSLGKLAVIKFFFAFYLFIYLFRKVNFYAVSSLLKTSLWNPAATITKTVLDVYPVFQSLEKDVKKCFIFLLEKLATSLFPKTQSEDITHFRLFFFFIRAPENHSPPAEHVPLLRKNQRLALSSFRQNINSSMCFLLLNFLQSFLMPASTVKDVNIHNSGPNFYKSNFQNVDY